MATATQSYTIHVTTEERAQLLHLIDQAVRDKHAEARRTENPSYQMSIHEEEMLLRNLADKVRECSLTLMKGPGAL